MSGVASECLVSAFKWKRDLSWLDFELCMLLADRPSDESLDVEALGIEVGGAFTRFQHAFSSGRSGSPPRLVLEPGRFLVAEAGFLVAQVNTLKDVAGRAFAGIDSGE